MDIRNLSAFETMTATQRENFINASEPVAIAQGNQLLTRGATGGSVYIIGTGKLRVHIGDTELAVLTAPCIVGEVELLTGEPYAATVTALEVCEGYEVSYDALRARLADGDSASLKFVHAVARVLARRLTTMNEKVVEVLSRGDAKTDLAALRTKLYGEWS